ncbi:MAG: GDP-mannose 4,6-dehydratase, partial [Candidatus Hadarchaeales archaeon]
MKPLNIPREYDSSEKLKKISRVLVTGVAGFMGSHLAERFISDGVEVVGIDNFSCGFMENLENLVKKKEFHLVKGDIR